MKAEMLAGGLDTRWSEETTIKPKPMGEIGSPLVKVKLFPLLQAA